MLRVCCAAFRIPCVSLAICPVALWHFGTFVFYVRFLGFLRLLSLNCYLPSTYKVSLKSHSLKFSSQNPINPIFLSHYLSLFRSACSFFRSAYVAHMLRVSCADVALRFVSLAYPLRIPCDLPGGTLGTSVRIHCFMRDRSNQPQEMAQLIVTSFF